MKILMVCLGNICRSPLAEGILKEKTKNIGVQVDSAGTASYHIGNPPDKRSIDIANKYNINISTQRARKFHYSDFSRFDIIYAMDKDNYAQLMKQANSKEEKNKIRMILNEIEPKSFKSVPDPYYGGDNGFQEVYNLLSIACEKIALRIE
tara:strand:- start:282 stop:731 length:450 start_codon:yes stop_codon:yes gene_type:complete